MSNWPDIVRVFHGKHKVIMDGIIKEKKALKSVSAGSELFVMSWNR